MTFFKISCSAAFILILIQPQVRAQGDGNPSRLTPQRIFSTNEFRGDSAGPWRWAEGRDAYLTLEPSSTHRGRHDLILIDAKSGRREVLVRAEQLIPSDSRSPLHLDNYFLSRDHRLLLIYTNSRKVWRQNTRGDYWVLDRHTGRLMKLGGDAAPSTLMFAKLSPDGKHAGYVRENNLYVQELESGTITPLTRDGSAHVINGTFDWVYEEELDCRDGWRWSPDGQSIAYWQLDTTGVPVFTMINNTDGLYPRTITFPYPKTGEQNSSCRVGVIPAVGGETRWVKLEGNPRDHYVARMEWSRDGKHLLLQRLNRLQNENHVLRVDAATGIATTLWADKDDAWIDLHLNGLTELENGQFLWISERDGWRHLFLQEPATQRSWCNSPGEFDIIQLIHPGTVADDRYFLASPGNPGQRYLYRLRASPPNESRRVTPEDQPGTHQYDISPSGRWAIHTWSSFLQPPRTDLISLPEHMTVRVLNDNARLRAGVRALQKGELEYFRVGIGDGIALDGWLMKPPEFDPGKKYPLLFYVYGEPMGQTVTDAWHGNQYLWHLMLTQRGYLVASVDNRGTMAPKGRAWRKAIYRQIGTLAARDQAASARELLKRPYVDRARIGIWGWSGGGTMTLNMLFRHPDLYQTGIAIASVPDMRLYDTIYQERYMGLPQQNGEDYRRGSPLTYAGQFKGNLLLIHGTGDDNVHYQGAEKLINALIAANKPFNMFAYPNRSHGISEGHNTSRHLYEMMTQYLNEKLPPGPR